MLISHLDQRPLLHMSKAESARFFLGYHLTEQSLSGLWQTPPTHQQGFQTAPLLALNPAAK